MDDAWLLSYRIDRTDRISAVNDAWVAFALANNGRHLLPDVVLGRHLWDMVGDLRTRDVYEALLRRVRETAQPLRLLFRCDSPTLRRLLGMQIIALPDGEVEFATSVVRDEPRVPMPLLDARSPRSADHLTICGWCMRAPVEDGTWLELEDAVPRLNLFGVWPLPRLHHEMCPSCHETVMRALAAPITDGEALQIGAIP